MQPLLLSFLLSSPKGICCCISLCGCSFACHSERSEEPPHFAFVFLFVFPEGTCFCHTVAFAVVLLAVIPEGDLLLLFEKPPPNESASSSEFS
jgi:hypothetical protein